MGPSLLAETIGKDVVWVVKEPVVRAPSGENAEWWKSRVVSAPNGESAGGESAVVRTPMVRCPVTVIEWKNWKKWIVWDLFTLQETCYVDWST